jgi:hypothetical protein
MRYRMIGLAAGGLLLCAAADAAAQSSEYMNLMRSQNQQAMSRARIYSNVRSGARITRYGEGSPAARGATRPGASARANAQSPGRPFQAHGPTFRTVAPSLMPREMARELARSPAERQQIEKNFEEYLAFYRGRLRQAGKPVNDVARAATYLAHASYTSYFNMGELSQPHFDALYEDMRDMFAADEQFQRASDAERQKMFESYAIVGILIIQALGRAKEQGDQDAMLHWREMARANWVNLLGIPPEQVRLTLRGIEYRS